MDGCDDEPPASTTRGDSVLKWRNGKMFEASDGKAEAHESVLDERTGWKSREERRYGDELLQYYLPHGGSVHVD